MKQRMTHTRSQLVIHHSPGALKPYIIQREHRDEAGTLRQTDKLMYLRFDSLPQAQRALADLQAQEAAR